MIVLAPAEADLARLAVQLSEGEAFLDAAERTMQLLAEWPLVGRRRRFRRRGVRSHVICPPFQNWIVFYQVTETEVVILRVVDGRRDLPPLFGGA